MRSKQIIIAASLIISVLLIGALIVTINLPAILSSQTEKHLSRLLDSDRIECQITKIGFNQFHLSNIYLASGIAIDDIDVRYRLKGLSVPALSTIKISGVTIHARLDENNKIHLNGFELPKRSNSPGPPVNSEFLPEKLVLDHGRLVLEAFGEQTMIPFDALATINAAERRMTVQSKAVPIGQPIRSQVVYHLDNGIEKVEIDARSLDLCLFNRFVNQYSNMALLQGLADLSVRSKAVDKEWNFNLSHIGISTQAVLAPIAVNMEQIGATLRISQDKIDVSGQFDLILAMVDKIPLQFNASVGLTPGMTLQARIKKSKTDHMVLNLPAGRVELRRPRIEAGFNGDFQKGTSDLLFAFDSATFVPARKKTFKAISERRILGLKKTTLMSTGTIDFSAGRKSIQYTFIVNNQGVNANLDDTTLIFPEGTVSGRMGLNKADVLSINGVVEAANGTASLSRARISASGIKLKLPFSFPNGNPKAVGLFSIPTVSYNNQYHGSTEGQVVQTRLKQLKIKGNTRLKAIPDFSGEYEANIDLQEYTRVDIQAHFKPFVLTDSDLKRLDPLLMANAVFKTTLAGNAKILVKDNHIDSRLLLNVTDGRFELPENHLIANGISTMVDIVDLINFRSLPSQTMNMALLEVNKVKISDAIVRFNIENQHSFLVENLKFNWCNGLVSSEAIRFPQKDNMYRLTLYCDRLELSQLLQQLGAFESEGNGTLNGRIPIIYQSGNISFANGFLFSTPGSGGRVAIANANKLTAGIPMNTPQFSQLDLAQEALKDFNYQWAKLKLNTVGDTLSVAMELDGKPTKTLPFRYQKEFGGFVRVDAASPGSNFQGIKLDVNLTLPFNEVMKFGNKLKTLFK